MASLLSIVENSQDVLREIYDKSNEAEDTRAEEHRMAVVVQAWYRACRSRQYLKQLHLAATEIQRVWRGFAARKRWRAIVRLEVYRLRSEFYDFQATQIQRTWRGFFSRKYTHDYYALRRYLARVEAMNEAMQRAAEEAREAEEARRLREMEMKAHKKLVKDSKCKHHLISTYQIPGVYNSPYKKHPDETEFRLKAVAPLMAHEQRRESLAFHRQRRQDEKKIVRFPPLHKKPQGPFKDPQKVYMQRHKPLSPSLRVATSYFTQEEAREAASMEEQVNRVQEDQFKLVGSINYPYKPLEHTLSEYRPLGTNLLLKQNQKEKWIAKADLFSHVREIPHFDKFNKVYDDHCHHCSY